MNGLGGSAGIVEERYGIGNLLLLGLPVAAQTPLLAPSAKAQW
jgi:hypothetical protein